MEYATLLSSSIENNNASSLRGILSSIIFPIILLIVPLFDSGNGNGSCSRRSVTAGIFVHLFDSGNGGWNCFDSGGSLSSFKQKAEK